MAKNPILQQIRRGSILLADALIVVLAALLSLFLHFEWNVPAGLFERTLIAMLWIIPLFIIANIFMGIYKVLWRYADGMAFVRLGLSSLLAGSVSIVINLALSLGLSSSVLLLTCVFTFGFSAVLRYGWRVFKMWQKNHIDLSDEERPIHRVLIVGGGSAGSWVIAQQAENPFSQPVAVVDDAPSKRGLHIQGVPVVGGISDIPRIVETYRIDDIIIAIPSLKSKRLSEIATLCASTKRPVKTISEPQMIDANGNPKAPVLRKINTADFLSRDEVTLDTKSISGYLTGKVILVTGGGGSIGSEICRQVMRFSPELLIAYDSYENGVYELYNELRQKYGYDLPVDVCIGSVKDMARLDAVFKRYKPSVVFHAAAHKHVPLMEAAPLEAIKNNIFGTRNVLEAADQNGVERFVILSTDKAVNPTNVMGATKRVTEMLIQSYATKSPMKCMAVRFGNVLGSYGSVIPLFAKQIENGGPVTLTHPDMQRYFMTIPEAAQLVLQAGGLAQDGAIYVLDMGEPMRIYDLAEQLIRFYGYEPNVDIKIEVTGLRPGEKLYEELLMDEEAALMEKTSHDLIFVAPPISMDTEAFWDNLAKLEKIGEQEAEGVEILEKLVSTFRQEKKIAV